MDGLNIWFLLFISLALQAILLFIWTLLVRTIPAIIGNAFAKRIQHGYDVKLEHTKTELQESFETLRSSVDFLSSMQSELRVKVIESVEILWSAVRTVESEFSDVVGLHTFIYPAEINSFLEGEANGPLVLVDSYRDFDHISAKIDRIRALPIEESRLFVGERLWYLFFVFQAFHGRIGYLMHESIKRKKYVDWREDDFIVDQLKSILQNKVVESAKQDQFSGIHIIVSHLETEFLKEATRVMSGSQALADSLSDIQATVQFGVLSAKEMKARRVDAAQRNVNN